MPTAPSRLGADDPVVGHVGYGPPGRIERSAPPRLQGLHPRGPVNSEALIRLAVHERWTGDRYATRKLYDLLAGWRPPRRSAAGDRQTAVTAQLDELHPKKLKAPGWLRHHRPRVIEVRRRVA